MKLFVNKAVMTILLGVAVLLALGAGATGQPKLPGVPNLPAGGDIGGVGSSARGNSESASDNLPVNIELVPQYERPGAGQSFYVAVMLDINDEWHLYANPNQGTGMAVVLTGQGGEGVSFGEPIYPTGEPFEQYGYVDDVYHGKVTLYLPVRLGDAVTGQREITVQLKGQLCNDTACKVWQGSGSVTIMVGSEPDMAVYREDVFASLASLTAGGGKDAIDGGGDGAPGSDGDSNANGDGALADDEWVKPVVLALGAGLIMNLMPCVLPLIPIIVMTLIQRCQVAEGVQPRRRDSLKVGIAFALGILVVFAGLAVVMSAFKLLWGQQFQSHGFKFTLLMLVYVLSLSMFGVFDIVLPARLSNMSVNRKGYLGAFGMGALATVLATPCGAPLLAPVLAWSVTKPLAIIIVVFLVVGAGMAVPYVLLTAFPKLLNKVPKAGNWMILLKHALGFAMLGFAVYLLLLFPTGWVPSLLYYCVVIGFALWLAFHAVTPVTPAAKRNMVRVVSVLLIVGASWWLYQRGTTMINTAAVSETQGNWAAQRDAALSEGKVTVVKFTANWCKNCQFLDKSIYKTADFQNYLQEHDVALVIADWSNEDETIRATLEALGETALPVAAVYAADDNAEPVVLNGMYSRGDLIDAIETQQGGGH